NSACQPAPSIGGSVPVTGRVRLVVGPDTDQAADAVLTALLRSRGVTRIERVAAGSSRPRPGLLTIHLGDAERADVDAALSGTSVPTADEGYALRSSRSWRGTTVAIGGVDGSGQFYAVQTLRQLLQWGRHGWQLPQVGVTDWPAMPLRGTIEGFYGPPWTPAERLDQMDFYGQVKANTYIYAPKDDPYHRDRWRDPYPADKLAELGTLVQRAGANHVRFTFAVSPGGSICYSDRGDRDKLEAKLQSMYDLGVRAFSVPLDDISYTSWNCPGDEAAYGAPGRLAAAKAQVSLLNDLQRRWVAGHPGARPLQMVPTEYGDLTDTAYKQQLRSTLDPAVVVMWTGTAVVPPSITNEQADRASALFGRKVFVWDNYPVNDYGNTAGRLLLAPYDKREGGLSDHLSGIVANPMNQPYASKVAVFGAADFTWNDRAYDADVDWPRAMSYLAGGNHAATTALLVFGDLEHLAPTFSTTPWQPQAPELGRRVARFWELLDGAHPARAVAGLKAYAAAIQRAPATIRRGSVQAGFVADAGPWLDATELWGRAMVVQLDAVTARLRGEVDRAKELTDQSRQLQARASEIRVDPPRNAWGAAKVKVGDGVLDTFLDDAADLVAHPVAVKLPAKALLAQDGSTSVPLTITNRVAGRVAGVHLRVQAPDGVTVAPVELDLGDLATGESREGTVRLSWSGDSTPTARAVPLTATVEWSTRSGTERASSSSDLQATCALTPTRPTAATADSEETTGEDAPVGNAIDGDTSTFWHTQWSGGSPPPPHQITMDLGATRSVCAVRYLPRQDSANGQIKDYEVYASADGTTWGAPVATGFLAAGFGEKWIPFAQTDARYVKLVALTEQHGNPWTTAAEVSVDAR
ncbi:MAG: beta-N-acetylglucosaminidase domain-containing protein, partial [Intrasporangium sp.]|uniref:beta-N-acetylglucosaminidase domain-containing protein n=1 Tax=Intrasporangium sp. TaxID=1925024 RepID=UPI00264880A2